MNILQKSGSNRTTFEFLDDGLKYSIKDSSGSNAFFVDYESIPYKGFSEIEERNSWLKNVGILWCLLGFGITGIRLFENGSLSISMWVFVGLICLLVYSVAKTSYTVLDTGAGRIFVIQDGSHDEILGVIDDKRKRRWNASYNILDLENDPENEIGKFKWLMQRGVIDESEFNAKVAEITSFHSNSPISKYSEGRTLN